MLNLLNDTNRDLLLRLQSGDEAAFTKIYNIYSGRILGKLLTLVKSEAIAADLLQETFIRLWNRHRDIDPNRSIRSYLFCIAENLVIDFFRKAARDTRLRNELIIHAVDHYQHVEEILVKKERSSLLKNAIRMLPTQRRQVFQLVKQEQRSYAEVSRLLSISTSTISDHIVKATKFIRSKLDGNSMVKLLILGLTLFC